MKFKLIAISFVSLLLIVALALMLFINRHDTPLLDGKVYISYLQQPVRVRFDQLYVPYIEARSEKDLTIAQGFVAASQRLFEMDLLRRLAHGETAALFGSAALPNDRLSHILGFKRLADAEYRQLLPETKNWLKAYCQGVNNYISRGNLPLEFTLLAYEPQPWQPEDTLAILKYLQYSCDECWQLNALQNAIAQKAGIPFAKQLFGKAFKLSPLTPSQPVPQNVSPDDSAPSNSGAKLQPSNLQPVSHNGLDNSTKRLTSQLNNLIAELAPPSKLNWGSTGFLIARNLSRSGAPLLAGAKDTLFTVPNLFCLTSLRAPFFHVAGLSIPGIPGIIIGRNEHFAWTAISLKSRNQELYAEQFSTSHINQYCNKKGSFQAKELHEEIQCRFAPSRVEKILLTTDGPLIAKNSSLGVALSWYGFDPANNTLDAIFALNRAKSWPEFGAALEKYKGSPELFLFADDKGNTAEYIASFNKHSGMLIAQNEPAAGQFITASEGQVFPDLLAINNNLFSAGSTFRTKRAIDCLTYLQDKSGKLSLKDLITLQSDCKASLSKEVSQVIKNTLTKADTSDQYSHAASDTVQQWDGQLTGASIAATIYETFLTLFTQSALQNQIGEKLATDYLNKWPYWTQYSQQLLNQQLAASNPHSTFYALNSLSQSLKLLRLTFDANPLNNFSSKAQWQNLHKIDFRHNLSRFVPESLSSLSAIFLPGRVGTGGDQDCLNSINYQINNDSPLFLSDSGPSARILIDLADNDKFYHSLSSPQSAQLFSRDKITNKQLHSWQNLEFHSLAFSSKQLGLAAKHTLLLDNSVE